MTNSKKTHSRIGASSCERWWNCPGSVTLNEKVGPKAESIYALEGTAAHTLLEWHLKRALYSVRPVWLDDKIEVRDSLGEDRLITVSESMVDAVNEALTFVESEMKAQKLYHEGIRIEVSLDLTAVHPDAYGTADIIMVAPFGNLTVCDYKHGAGVAVEVGNNKQLLYYALGAFLSLTQEEQNEVEAVELVVIQPRAHHHAGPIRRSTVSVDHLLGFAGDLLEAASRVDTQTETYATGNHCKFCNAKSACPAVKTQFEKQARVAFAEYMAPPKPEEFTPLELSALYTNCSLYEDFLADVKEWIKNQTVVQGKELPGYKVIERKGRLIWKKGIDEASVIEEYGSAVATTKLKTPKQVSESVASFPLDKLAERSSSTFALTLETDPRPKSNKRSIENFQQYLIEKGN